MRALTKLILSVVIGLVVSFIMVLYLIQPTLKQVLRLNQELTDKKTETKTLEQQILAFKTAQSDLSKATQKDRILNAVVAKEDLVLPVKDLEAAAARSNSEEALMITDSDSTAGTAPKTVKPITEPIAGTKEVQFEVSVRNDFVGLMTFLRYVENSPYFTELTNLQLTGETSAGSDTTADQATVAVHTGQIVAKLKGVFFVTNETSKK